MSQIRMPFPHSGSSSFFSAPENSGASSSSVSSASSQEAPLVTPSVSSQGIFSATSKNERMLSEGVQPLEKLLSEITLKLGSHTDDELMLMMNEAIESNRLGLKEAADLFYALALINQANRELRGAAMTLQLKVAQQYASDCEWYFDRLFELEKIAKKLSFSSDVKVHKWVLNKLLTTTKTQIELIDTLCDPLLSSRITREWYAANALPNSIVSLLVSCQSRKEDKQKLTLTEMGEFPILLEFFQGKNNSQFQQAAREKYKIVDQYRSRHTKLLSLSYNEKLIKEEPNFQLDTLEKFLIVINAELSKKFTI